MPSGARHTAAIDPAVLLAAGGICSEDFPITAPDIDPNAQALVALLVEAQVPTTFRLALVGHTTIPLGTFREQAGGGRIRRVVIKPGKVPAGGSTLRITVTAGCGQFSDLTFWYQARR